MYALALVSLLAFSCSNEKKEIEPNETPVTETIDLEEQFKISMQLHDSSDYDSALVICQNILEVDSQNFDAKLLEGDIMWALRNLEASLSAYTTCLRWQDHNPKVWTRLGKVFLEKNDQVSAIKYFNQAVNLDPSNGDGYIGRAIVFAKKEQWDQAYLSLQTALDFNPDNQKAALKLAQWKADEALYGEEMNEAMIAKKMAFQYFQVALNIDSSDAHVSYLKGAAHANFLEFDQAETDFKRAISLDKKNTEYHFNLAYLYFRQEKFEKAIVEYNYCLSKNQKDTDALYGIALCAIDQGNKEKAIETLKKVLEINPEDEDAQLELGKLQ